MQQYLEEKHSLATLLKHSIAQVNQLEDSHNLAFSEKSRSTQAW